jgi:hypothetical protein
MGFGYKMDQEYVKYIENVRIEDVLRVRESLKKAHQCVVVEP